MEEIIISFEKSLKRLEEILGQEESETIRDAAIQRFEFTIELAWKLAQKFLKSEEIICRSPKECLKEAFKFGLIKDDPRWFEMLSDRNLTVHAYDEETAKEIYKRLPNYLEVLKDLLGGLRKNGRE
ncbi:MAG: HI0074 family nucleotidyltransferase substrate-binding subunit [bacterium]